MGACCANVLETASMAGTFEIYKDGRGEHRFRLKPRNGEIVASGESDKTKTDAKKCIAAVQRAAVGAAIDDQSD